MIIRPTSCSWFTYGILAVVRRSVNSRFDLVAIRHFSSGVQYMGILSSVLMPEFVNTAAIQKLSVLPGVRRGWLLSSSGLLYQKSFSNPFQSIRLEQHCMECLDKLSMLKIMPSLDVWCRMSVMFLSPNSLLPNRLKSEILHNLQIPSCRLTYVTTILFVNWLRLPPTPRVLLGFYSRSMWHLRVSFPGCGESRWGRWGLLDWGDRQRL